MNKKRWSFIILGILLLFGYYKLFYKTWNNEGVIKTADVIIALDVKKITNTVIWNFITSPSQWKSGNLFPQGDGVSWNDMLEIPDFIFIFHKQGQPSDAFYTVVEINDREDFEKGLQQYHFEKTSTGSLLSKETGIELMQNGDKVIIANAAVEDKKYLAEVAAELFTKKQFIDKDSLRQFINGDNHLAASFPVGSNNFLLGNNQFVTGNFDWKGIYFSTALDLQHGVNLSTNRFMYSGSSLCSIGFTLPWPNMQSSGTDSLHSNLSRIVNFNIDSLLLPSNQYYQLDIAGIYPRIDSAISYTYDNDFNPVEKVVVNKVEEPAFNFLIKGDSVINIYNYWNNSGKLEKRGDSNLFTPIPFVASYCQVANQKELRVTSNNYKTAVADKSIECVLFAKLQLTKLPSSIQAYIPSGLVKLLKNISTAEASVKNEKGQHIIRIDLHKKINDQPPVEL